MPVPDVNIDFCGEWFPVAEDQVFSIGREGDLEIDDNPYLHRRFMEVQEQGGIWWLSNVGTMISAAMPVRMRLRSGAGIVPASAWISTKK